MTNSTEEISSPIRAAAQKLARQLDDYDQFPGLKGQLRDYLSPAQQAYLFDSWGLLASIGAGIVVNSQPRIFDGLAKIVTELADQVPSEQNDRVVNAIISVISQAASHGLTADHHSFGRQRIR